MAIRIRKDRSAAVLPSTCLLLAVLALCSLPGGSVAEATGGNEAATEVPTTCFIIRTYWGHGDTWGDKSLRRILSSLRNQTVDKWEALLLVLDNRPFPELRKIVRELNDPRIWVHAEWVNYKYAPKEGGIWAPHYHNRLYNLTDAAIRACPSHAKWVVVTNGDNTYDPTFLEEVLAAPPDSDVVAVDFYSRYQRPTAAPCERFEEGPGLPPCKENDMRFCQTDLAANAYRLSRMLEEDRRFGTVDPTGGNGANDGILAQILKTDGWKIHFIHGRCLVNHAPSPQQCALSGGVWDDTAMANPASFGGACASARTVLEKMKANPSLYELLELNVTYDRNSFSYKDKEFVELKCLRMADRKAWVQEQTFGRVCAARVDFAGLRADLPPHPWDDWVPPTHEVLGVPAPVGKDEGDVGNAMTLAHQRARAAVAAAAREAGKGGQGAEAAGAEEKESGGARWHSAAAEAAAEAANLHTEL